MVRLVLFVSKKTVPAILENVVVHMETSSVVTSILIVNFLGNLELPLSCKQLNEEPFNHRSMYEFQYTLFLTIEKTSVVHSYTCAIISSEYNQ